VRILIAALADSANVGTPGDKLNLMGVRPSSALAILSRNLQNDSVYPSNEEWENMLIEKYPVGWAVDAGKPEPVLAYLIDLPGVAMQGRTFADAVAKLRNVAPEVLATYRREGRTLPAPSAEPNLQVGALQWLRARLFQAPAAANAPTAEINVGADVELTPA